MSQLSVDWSELSLQVMLTFGHFLWQGCLVALVLTIVERLSSIVLRSSSSRRYTLACLAFFALPICVASTFAWVHKSRGPVLLVAGSPVESPATPVASVSEPIPQDNRADVPMLPAPALPAEPESPVARPLETPSLSVTSVSWTQQIQSYAPSLLIAYAIGVLLMLGRFGLSVVGSSRIRRTVQPNTDSRLLKIVTQQSARMGLKRVPVVALCQRVSVPVVVGIVKPMILLPPALLCGLEPNQLAAILSHEIAHIRRYDLVVNLLQRVVEALLFFHPATWWISRRVSIERENCCDDIAADCTGRLPYASALLHMAELCIGSDHRRREALATLSADGGNTTDLGLRIRRLIGAEQTTRIGVTRRGIVAGLAMISIMLASLMAWAQNRDADKESHEMDVQWSTWGDKDGLLSGARLILPEGGLKPGQPLVVEYRLLNVSRETKTLKCLLNNGMKLTSLGRGNRISCFGFDWHPDPVTLTIDPGDVFVDAEHLVSIDTTGLEPGDYEAALGSAFHYPDDANPKTAHEIPHRGSIPFTIVGESRVKSRELPQNDIHWGNPVAGLQLGAKIAGDPIAFAIGATVEADLFVANVTEQPIECSVTMPARRDGWLFNVEDSNGNTVKLERPTPIDSYSPPQCILLKLAPGQIAPITSEGIFRVSMTPHSDVEPVQYKSPKARFQIVGSKDEAKSPWQVAGFPEISVFPLCTWAHEAGATQPWQDDGANWQLGKLISQGADFSTIFEATLLRPEIPSLQLHLDSGKVPFSVAGPDVQPAVLQQPATPKDESEPEPAADNNNWGPESEGLRCRIVPVSPSMDAANIEVAASVKRFASPEEITFAVEIKNVSNKAISLKDVRYGKDYAEETRGKLNTNHYAPHLLDLLLTDADGKVIARTQREFVLSSHAMILHTAMVTQVEPGQSLKCLLKPAEFERPMDYRLPPGDYRVQVRYRGPSQAVRDRTETNHPKQEADSLWSSEVTSQFAKFTIADEGYRKPDLVWGPETGGLQAALEIRVPREAGIPTQAPGVLPTTSLTAVLHVKNVSDKPIAFVSETGRQGDMLKIKNAKGEDVEVKNVFYTGWPIDVRWTLQSDDVAQLDVLTPSLNQSLAPGEYSAKYTIRFNSRQLKDKDGKQIFPAPGDYDSEIDTGWTPLFQRDPKHPAAPLSANQGVTGTTFSNPRVSQAAELKDDEVEAFVSETLAKSYDPKPGGGSWQFGAHRSTISFTLGSIAQQSLVADALMKKIELADGGLLQRQMAIGYCASNFPERLIACLVRRLSVVEFAGMDANRIDAPFPPYYEITALGTIGPQAREAIPVLTKHLKAADPIAREAAIRALVRVGPSSSGVMRSLTVCFNDENERVQSAAVYQAGRYGMLAKPLGPKFVELLDAESKVVQCWAAAALITSEFNPQFGFKELLKRAQAGSSANRQQALVALAMLGTQSESVLPKLHEMTDDPDAKVAKEVRETILRIETNDRIVTHAEEAAKESADRKAIKDAMKKLNAAADIQPSDIQ